MILIKLTFGMAVLIVLSGCSSAPYTYETVQGCGITQWNEKWVQNDVASMSWTGGCSDGRASGRGSHIIKLKNGKEIRYVGDMYNGRIYGSGTYIDASGWKSEGNFENANLTEGKLHDPNGKIIFDGKMANDIEYQGKTITYADGRYGTGKVYVVNGSYYEGEFNGSIGERVSGNVPQASIYARNVRDGVVVGWIVAGKKYPNETAYQVAKSQYEDRRKREIAAHQAAQAAKQAAEQRAYEQEQARKSEQNARETREALGQLIGAIGQYQQNTADRKQAQQEEQQRRLQEQQAQQQEQQRRVQEQQSRAYAAEVARVDALNREAALAAEQRANQKAIAANNTPIVGTVLNPTSTTTDSKQPTQSSSSKQPKEKKYHYPEYVATECLSLIKEKTLYGGFINSCPFKVAYGWCVEEPKKGGWSELAACGNETRGAGQVVGAKSRDGQHTKGGKKVHWVACMYEDRNGNFLDVGPRDVSWDGQKKQMKFRCGDMMPRK